MGQAEGQTETYGSEAASNSPSEAFVLHEVLQAERLDLPSHTHALAGVRTVRVGRGEAGEAPSDGVGGTRRTLHLDDRWASAQHATFHAHGGGWVVEDLGSKNGTRVNGAPITQPTRLAAGDVVEIGCTFFVLETIAGEHLETRSAAAHAMGTMSLRLGRDLLALESLASTPLPIVILGETGTGKEVLANFIHERSGRKGPFVAANCGAIPASLVEAELFGSRRGAFSGAVDRPGLVRNAEAGTFLLDEAGDMPEAAQRALLRVIQASEISPVGASQSVKVDVRFLAATHRDLQALVASGTFRADLWARLAAHVFRLPPLRERRMDLGLLLRSLLARHAGERRPVFHREVARLFFTYDWPLNIRELESCLRSAMALSGGKRLELAHLPAAMTAPPKSAAATPSREERRRARLLELLQAHRGNLTEVAKELGIARQVAHRWLKQYDIDADDYRD